MDFRNFSIGLGLLILAGCSQEANAPAASSESGSDVPWIVATAHPLATDAGVRVLEAGGTAADAAVAIQSVLGLVEPQSSGLGGGAFLLFYDAGTGELTAWDGRETAPASAFPEVFLKEDGTPVPYYQAVTGGYAVGVPGAVAMLGAVHAKHGALPWSTLLVDAEDLARDGFPMPQRMHDAINRFRDFRTDPAAAIYLDDEGNVLAPGSVVRNLDYAETLRALAEGGPASFYEGATADAIIARVNAKTGKETLTKEDFLQYRTIAREPICGTVLERRICSMPPPSSGGVTLLQIVKLHAAAAAGETPSNALLAYIEATRLAYADRERFLGDPDAMGTETVPARSLIEAMISDGYLAERAELIGSEPADEVLPGNPVEANIREGFLDDDSAEIPSTSHFSVRDSAGNIVSMTTSVEFPLGSQMMAAGMVLNNQLTDFALTPYRDGRLSVNAPGAGKRPRSSMTPMIIFDGNDRPIAALGSPGGSAIIGYLAKPLLRHLMTGEPLSRSIIEPHVVVPRGSVIIEEGGEPLAQRAEGLGYEVSVRPLSSGIYGFHDTGDGIDLIVDPRREGSARTALD